MEVLAPEIQDLLTTIYEDSSERQEAFNILTRLNTADSTSALLQLADNFRVSPYYPEILHQLNQRGVLDAMPYFQQILAMPSAETDDIKNQLTVVMNLGQYRQHEAAIPLLLHVLNHYEGRAFLQYGTYSIGRIGTDEAVYALAQLLQNHPDSQVRHFAVSALQLTHNPTAVTVLLNALNPYYGQMQADCPDTNVLSSLLNLWDNDIRPFDISRWLALLEYWLYVDFTHNQAAFTLRQLQVQEAKAILTRWEQHQNRRSEPSIFY